MAPPLLTLQDIHLTFGDKPLLVGAELSVSIGEKLCLVGRNGSGKSTLLKIAAGLVEPDEGERFLQPGTTLCYLAQEPDFSGYETAFDYVCSGLGPQDSDHEAIFYLNKLGVDAQAHTANLSGGEARRVALAWALAPRPDILLLDEPTNHLDLPTIEWLEKSLKELNSALVVISHDRRFLETVSRSTLWIDEGQTRESAKGFAFFESWRDEVLAQEELEAHKRDRKIVREEHWLRYGVTARRKRNQKRLAALHDLRAEKRTARKRQGTVSMEAQTAETSGKLVIDAEGLEKSFNDNVIIKELSLRLARGDKLGIVGPNGAGKTTLIKLLTGSLQADHGTIKIGSNVEMVTLDQSRESLKPNWTLQDALTNGGGDMVEVNGNKRHVIGYMKDFLFEPSQARTPLEALSGGERGRVMLARALSLPSNLMVLDEPTNDLDLETLDLLQELLSDYQGSLLLVSHDRDFLDRVVTSTLSHEEEGRWVEYAGGYSAMLEQRRQSDDGDNEAVKSNGERANKQKQRNKTANSQGKKSKLSYKDKYALETLPQEIEALEAQIGKLETQLADPNLFEKDEEGFHNLASELTAAKQSYDEKQEQWLELEVLREEVEGG